MFEEAAAWLTGASACRQFADGGQEQSGWLCWFFLAVLVISFASSFINYIKIGHGLKASGKTKLSYYAAAVAYLLLSAFIIWIFYAYAQRCKCFQGLLIVLVVSAVGRALIWAMTPDQINDLLDGIESDGAAM
jgi:hypothetical protein